jgi:hypothetical protein
MGLGTPLSLPTSVGSIHTGQGSNTPAPGHAFHGQHAMAQVFQNPNPFGFQQQQQHQHHHHQTFPPNQFSQHSANYDSFHPNEPSKMDDQMPLDVEMQEHIEPDATFSTQPFDTTLRHAPMIAPTDKYVLIRKTNSSNLSSYEC